MNILWIPHSPSEPGAHRRDQYFIRLLKDRHRVVTVTWQTWKSNGHFKAYWEGLRFYPIEQREVETYHVRRIPDPTRLLRRGGKYTSVSINQRLFAKDIRSIVEACDIDVLVAGPSSFMTGFPPFDLPIPFVFDYLDCADWDLKPNHPEKTYLQGCDAVLSVSAIAEERAEQYGKRSLLLPNGADIQKMRRASGEAVRK
jgi:hypothetical protein